ncbi:transcription-repair coupling factor [bacterium]|nr:transcription-repair coupling factor [bacterium]
MNDFSTYLKNEIAETDPFKLLLEYLRTDKKVKSVKGLVGSMNAIVAAALFEALNSHVLLIMENESAAEQLRGDLAALAGETNVAFFPPTDYLPHRKIHGDKIAQNYRMDTLERLMSGTPLIVVTSVNAVARVIPSVEDLKNSRLRISKGSKYSFKDIIRQLADFHFEREMLVEEMGQFSVRGGIVDVFPFSAENPYRIEFWGDEIESIREFNIETQRSEKVVNTISIYPVETQEQVDLTNEKTISYNVKNSIFSLFNKSACIMTDIPSLLERKLTKYQIQTEKLYHPGEYRTDERGIRKAPIFFWEEVSGFISKFHQVVMNDIGVKSDQVIEFKTVSQFSTGGEIEQLKKHCDKLFIEKKKIRETPIYFICDYRDQASRMQDVFDELDVDQSVLKVELMDLHGGFYNKDAGLAVYTDHQFYGRQRRPRVRRKFSKGLNLTQLKSLRRGDFVVHEDYGIGVYNGLKKINVGESERECLQIRYRENGMVYVPLDRMLRVQKFSAKEGVVPHVNKLGGIEWERLKIKTKAKIKDIARDLLEIYAARKALKGFSFGADTLWQKELEAAFPYEDTVDQSRSIAEIKSDMESERPMDRLLCGDVGFGKTEMAIRAAFKAVNGNKQVAVLVPTTILAEQHYRTFKARMKLFPVKVAVMSRFRSRKKLQQIAADVTTGKVDVLIGTHRILSKDIQFRNIGLLIIDEEQRFGVEQKEKLKSKNKTVDVLTMTATPIPRTLHMSLMGARDMSTINTAPKNRLPVYTEIGVFDEELIREAIMREIQRDGQVFFLYNRVQSIEGMASLVRRIVPEAKIAVAHGQMAEGNLERIMLRFLDKQYDVLVCTTIIESGLDLPNVNTIIMHRADRFGLAELYQLRGRVGRTNLRGYAYLLIPSIKRMNSIALKRLQTIEEFTDLGAGFQIAMRDLEIRGAGNLLGAEQSGFIAALGFDLYCKILDETVNELTGKSAQETDKVLISPLDVQVDSDVDVFIPDDYIDRGDMRLDYYRRLIVVGDLKVLREIRAELRDRFGRLPEEVKNLFAMLSIKISASQLGIKKVTLSEKSCQAVFIPEIYELKQKEFRQWLASLVHKATEPFEFLQRETLIIQAKFKTQENQIEQTKKFLKSLL